MAWNVEPQHIKPCVAVEWLNETNCFGLQSFCYAGEKRKQDMVCLLNIVWKFTANNIIP